RSCWLRSSGRASRDMIRRCPVPLAVRSSRQGRGKMTTTDSIILFDGVCNLCNSSVDFIIRRDRRARFRFASLQSAPARLLLREFGLDDSDPKSIVLIENGRAYCRSTAALRIARRLCGPWPLFYVLIVIPPALRDWIYDLMARNRYRWFGRRETCRVP